MAVPLCDRNVMKFRARLKTSAIGDLHREFAGLYYPDTRSLEVSELRTVVKSVKLLPMYPEKVYTKPGTGDTYVLEDLMVGAELRLGPSISQRDDGVEKILVITEADLSELKRVTLPSSPVDPSAESVARRAPPGLQQTLFQELMKDAAVRAVAYPFVVTEGSGARKLGQAQLRQTLQKAVPALNAAIINQVIQLLPTDRRGLVSLEHLLDLAGLKMSHCRRQAVLQAFIKVDYNRNGVISEDEFAVFYNAAYHPRVVTGERAEREQLEAFLANFDFDRDGRVTFAEFEDYYTFVSGKMDSDDEFLQLMDRAWNLDKRNLVGIPFH